MQPRDKKIYILAVLGLPHVQKNVEAQYRMDMACRTSSTAFDLLLQS